MSNLPPKLKTDLHPSKDPKVKKYHDAKYKIFRGLYEQQFSYRSTMAQALS